MRSSAPRIPDEVRDKYAELIGPDRELAPMIAAHKRAQDARRELLDKVRFFLPSVAVQDALDRIAGADADRALAFQDQVFAFRQQLRLLYRGYLDRDRPQTLDEYDTLPRFQFHETGGAFQAGMLADLAALVVATLLILIAAWALRARAGAP